eukprot:TRINITY_DN14335_c1_g1_i3.p1 TRINITY_DN14335_c1_g1~~TRINITY_DN14335_c1_g1_i3.p1  ORF type:complete len:359 (+),score=78.72 TRINITY_DN14335_c1_g1_i3:33-1109(+)
MSVSLQVVLPSQVCYIDAGANETIRDLKLRIASETGLDEGLFRVTFEGDALDESMVVQECPFDDQCEVHVAMTDNADARQRLRELGWEDKQVGHIVTELKKAQLQEEEVYLEIFTAMWNAGLISQEENIGPLLLIATRRGLLNLVEAILSNGAADVNYKRIVGNYKCTALHEALYHGEEAVMLLLKYGADPSILDSDGYSSLHRAISGGKQALVRMFLEGNTDPNKCVGVTGITTLQLCVRDLPEYVAIAADLLDYKADPNLRDYKKRETALHVACSQPMAYLPMVQLLVGVADVNMADRYGWTPLHRAVCGHYYDIVELLLKNGADKTLCISDQGVYDGFTPAMLATGPHFATLLSD